MTSIVAETPPDECPHGHRLGAGRLIVGWVPCQCPTARATQGGHRTWRCLACRREGWSMVASDPPHVRTTAEVLAEMAPWQARYDAAVREVEWLGDDPRVTADIAGIRRALAAKDARSDRSDS